MHWIVGDVQGCARELEDLLERIGFSRGADELICLGDVVNGGPDSLAVLRLLRDLGATITLGNHDSYALRVHSGAFDRRSDTLDELFAAHDREELFDWLRAQPILLELPGDEHVPAAWLVHAGLDPRWTDLAATAADINGAAHDDDWLGSPDVVFATRARCCTKAGVRSEFNGPPENCPPGFRPWDEFYAGTALAVHGHWARRGLYRGARTLGLDSGCVYGRELSAWCQEEDRVAQVPSRGAAAIVRPGDEQSD